MLEWELSSNTRQQPPARLRQLALLPEWARLSDARIRRLFAGTVPPAAGGASPPPPSAQPATRRPPLVPRGAGPATPEPAKTSKLLEAIWQVPATQQYVKHALSAVENGFKRGWERASPGERASVIAAGIVAVGGVVTGVMLDREQETVFKHLDGKDIPIPGLEGSSVRLHQRQRGVGATYQGGPVQLKADIMEGAGRRAVDFSFQITLDLSTYLP